MKLAFSTLGCPSYSWTDIYPIAKDLGFDGIEIRGIQGRAYAPGTAPFLPNRRERTRVQLERMGLEIPCFSSNCELSDVSRREESITEIMNYVELASDMGTPYVRVLVSRSIHPAGEVDDDDIVDVLTQLGGYAGVYDVTLLVETIAEYADTARLARVLDRVGMDSVGALWDLHHPYRVFGEDPSVSVANLGHHLHYCQVKDSVQVGDHFEYRMMGDGDLPLHAMFDALRDAGYDGYMSFEWVTKWARDIAVGEAGIVFPQFLGYMLDYQSGVEAPAAQPVVHEPHRTAVAPAVEFELQHSLTNDGTYPWPKEHLIDETFPQLLDRICELYPRQYAFRFTEPDSWYNPDPDVMGEYYVRTYPQFRADVDEFARSLIAMGVKPGDKVAIWASNVPQWYLTFWAAVKIGAVLVTVNTGYKIHELEYLLRQSDTHTLVMIDAYKGTSYLDIIDELIPQINGAKAGEWTCKKLPFLKNIVTIDGPHQGCYSWGEALALGTPALQAEVERRSAALDKHDVCNMQYTSGTTGFPKGVMLTHRNVVNDGKCIGDRMGLSTADRMMIQVPMFHCFGMTLSMTSSMTHGTTMCPMPYFSAKTSLSCITNEKITCFNGVPTMFIAMFNHPDYRKTDFSYMRTGIMAGSGCPPELMKRAAQPDEMNMRGIVSVYGQTETAPGNTMSAWTDPLDVRTETVGYSFPHVLCKVIDPETGNEVPPGVNGEFCAKGYNQMKGYYKMPEATRETIDADGWLHSGDLACKDENGNYRITGRLKDMIIRGGENLYPREIEEFLYTHPAVQDVQVIGVPDEKYGEEAMACIILKEGQEASEPEIRAYCVERLARHKVPKYIRFVDSFPMNAAGKILKYKMREEAAKELGLSL